MRTPLFLSATPSVSATNYVAFFSDLANSTESQYQNLSPISGNIEGFQISLSVAPDNGGGTQSYAITLRINGVDSSASCTVSEANTTCTSTTVVSVSAGDLISFKIVPSGTPVSVSLRAFSIFNSLTGGDSVILSSSGVHTHSTSTDFALSGRIITSQAFGNSSASPTSGSIRNLYIKLQTAPGSGKSRTFELNLNGASSALTCTVSDTNTTCNDTTHSVSIIQGSVLKIVETATNSPANTTAAMGLSFAPLIDGESIFLLASVFNTPSTSLDSFERINGSQAQFTTTEANVQQAIQSTKPIIVKKMYFSGTAPGSSKSVVISLRVGGVSQALTCTVANSSTSCSDNSNQVTLNDNTLNLVNIMHHPVSTPSTVGVQRFGVVLYIDPSDEFYAGTYYDSTLY